MAKNETPRDKMPNHVGDNPKPKGNAIPPRTPTTDEIKKPKEKDSGDQK